MIATYFKKAYHMSCVMFSVVYMMSTKFFFCVYMCVLDKAVYLVAELYSNPVPMFLPNHFHCSFSSSSSPFESLFYSYPLLLLSILCSSHYPSYMYLSITLVVLFHDKEIVMLDCILQVYYFVWYIKCMCIYQKVW